MKILFWLRSRKTQKIIHARITSESDTMNFSTGVAVLPELWLGSDNLINPLSKVYIEQNNTLSQIRAELIRAYNDLRAEHRTPTALMVHERYLLNRKMYNPIVVQHIVPTIADILAGMMETKKTELGMIIGHATYKRYERFQLRFIEYLKTLKISVSADITQVGKNLLNGWLKWMLETKQYTPAYVNKHRDYILLLRYTCRREVNEAWVLNWVMKDIMKLKVEEPKLVFITPEEIDKVQMSSFVGTLERVKDMFVFMIETGVHIAEYRRIREIPKIDTDTEGDKWISLKRKKTNVAFDILVSDTAQAIIEKYGSLAKLPIMNDQKFNDMLKILGERCGLSVELTSKVARKTFCNMHLNTYGVRTDIVASLMGLANDRCIKHYGQINRSRIKEELRKTM